MLVKGQTHAAMLDVATEIERFIETYLPIGGHNASQPDSPHEAEERAGLPRSGMPDTEESVLHHARRAAQWKTWAGLDCVEGLVACIRQVKSLVSIYPLGRTAIEAFAGAAWLLEPGIGPQVRAHRGLLDHRKSLDAQLSTVSSRANHGHLYSHEAASAYADAVAHYKKQLSLLRKDLKAVRSLLPEARARDKLPSLTHIVESALDDVTGEEGVGTGHYGELCELVHPGTDAMNQLINSGSTKEFLNIRLSRWVVPLLASCYAMQHCLVRRADYYHLPHPEPHLEPVHEALHEVAILPPDTLLLEPPSDPGR